MKSEIKKNLKRVRRRQYCGGISGFTLIELMLVMVILAVMAAIVLPKFTGRSQQAKITAAKTQIAQLEVALDAFEIDSVIYPRTLGVMTTCTGIQANTMKMATIYIPSVRTVSWVATTISRIGRKRLGR